MKITSLWPQANIEVVYEEVFYSNPIHTELKHPSCNKIKCHADRKYHTKPCNLNVDDIVLVWTAEEWEAFEPQPYKVITLQSYAVLKNKMDDGWV